VPDLDTCYRQWDGYHDPGQTLTCFTTNQIEGWNKMASSNPEYERFVAPHTRGQGCTRMRARTC